MWKAISRSWFVAPPMALLLFPTQEGLYPGSLLAWLFGVPHPGFAGGLQDLGGVKLQQGDRSGPGVTCFGSLPLAGFVLIFKTLGHQGPC